MAQNLSPYPCYSASNLQLCFAPLMQESRYKGASDLVVIRCGSKFEITTRSYLWRVGQNSKDASDDASDILTVLANTCKHLIDLKPAPASTAIAGCIVSSLREPTISELMFGGGGPDYFKQVKEENTMELIDTANRFAVHTLLILIIRQVILKPIYLKKMTVDQMLLKWDNHPFVLTAILQELQQRINAAPQVCRYIQDDSFCSCCVSL
jgi:hypothetical protein